MEATQFKEGAWVAFFLPNGKKSLGVLDNNNNIQYVSEYYSCGSIPVEQVTSMAEITIDWDDAEK